MRSLLVAAERARIVSDGPIIRSGRDASVTRPGAPVKGRRTPSSGVILPLIPCSCVPRVAVLCPRLVCIASPSCVCTLYLYEVLAVVQAIRGRHPARVVFLGLARGAQGCPGQPSPSIVAMLSVMGLSEGVDHSHSLQLPLTVALAPVPHTRAGHSHRVRSFSATRTSSFHITVPVSAYPEHVLPPAVASGLERTGRAIRGNVSAPWKRCEGRGARREEEPPPAWLPCPQSPDPSPIRHVPKVGKPFQGDASTAWRR